MKCKLVPEYPTEKMITAGMGCLASYRLNPITIYNEMVKVVPEILDSEEKTIVTESMLAQYVDYANEVAMYRSGWSAGEPRFQNPFDGKILIIIDENK